MAHPDTPTGQREQFVRAERTLRALELYKSGYSYRAISAEMGVDYHLVWDYVHDALDELNRARPETTEMMRRVQGEQLRDLIRALWPLATLGHLQVIDRVLRIQERLAKLYGLDAPAQVDVTVRLRELAESLGLDADDAVMEAERLISATHRAALR